MGKNWEGWEKEEREAGHLLSYHSREWWWGRCSLARRGKRGEHQLILGNRQPTALTILPQYEHLVITLSPECFTFLVHFFRRPWDLCKTLRKWGWNPGNVRAWGNRLLASLGEEWPNFPLSDSQLWNRQGGTNRAELFEADIRGNFDNLSKSADSERGDGL